MKKTEIDRKTLAEKFDRGILRKMGERELLTMMAINEPQNSELYHQLFDYLELDIRYYEMAKQYYLNDLEPLEHEYYQDLVMLTTVDITPREYAEYLRIVDRDERNDEKITHAALNNMKKAIHSVVEEFR